MVAVPLDGLVGAEPLDFPLYLPTSQGRSVLYRDTKTTFDDGHLARLRQEGVERILIRAQDRGGYSRRIEHDLDALLRNKNAPLVQRVEILYGVATSVADDLLRGSPSREDMRRAEMLFASTATLVTRETKAQQAIRQMLRASASLAQHSLTVGMLSLALARIVISSDVQVLVRAGLAGLLHDIGRVGHSDTGADEDPDHPQRGFETLTALGLAKEVCEAALYHHERLDGRGYPRGIGGDRIPVFSRIVAIVDSFDSVYSQQRDSQPRVGVFDALKILAQVYRGCFDDRLAVALVQLFAQAR